MKIELNKWDKRFLDLAYTVARWSKDPSTKCGAVIAKGRHLQSIGFNGFPAGYDDSANLYLDREDKYKHVLHAEANAILSAKQDLHGCTLFVVPLPPCSHCAAVIAQTGIIRVVTVIPAKGPQERWGDSMLIAKQKLKHVGIEYVEV